MSEDDKVQSEEGRIPEPIADTETFARSLSTITSVATTFMAGISQDDEGLKEILPYVQVSIDHDGREPNFQGLIPLDNALFAAFSLLFGVREAMEDLQSLSKGIPASSSRFEYMRQWLSSAREQLDMSERALLELSKTE